jgi:squalene/oxidosqualene cyclase-like protein
MLPESSSTRSASRRRDTTPESLSGRAMLAIRLAHENLGRLQAEDGHWPGDYGGPMFLLPMLVALYHATGTLGRVPAARRAGMVKYFWSVQHEDGSIGLHAEDPRGMLFTTVLGYVALRILGVEGDDPRLVRMRGWIHANGGPVGAAPWGKWTLCLLGLYEWRGVHPVLPELWLLPPSLPFHPGRLWCHCRQVYLPVAWLYGKKARIPDDALIVALREELYDGQWSQVDWEKAKSTLSSADTYRPKSVALKVMNRVVGSVEQHMWKPLRRRALAEVFDHIAYEDDVTSGIDIGPVNKVLNAFVHHFAAEGQPNARLARALDRTDDYLWDAPDGTKMQGYNGSQLWDTAFATQALLASPLESGAREVLDRAYDFIRDTQILEDVPNRERYYRHASRGGWPFSTRAHGWPITDCTAEGLKCALALASRFGDRIPTPLLEDSVNLLLSWQNDDGGWATYERQRAGAWLEKLNPSEVFGNIMVDYSYVECTSAALQALSVALKAPALGLPTAEVQRAIDRGVAFLRHAQRPDGSFEGSWAVCFTYGTWFAVSGLLAAGVSPADPAIRTACEFLVAKQREDGSWGEDGDSCREGRWVEAAAGHVVQTSWALLTLTRAHHPNTEVLARAAAFLVQQQDRTGPDAGQWPKQPLVGVFNRTCLIDYDNYRHYFPLWALAEWLKRSTKAGINDA